jgi:hypothetical protein
MAALCAAWTAIGCGDGGGSGAGDAGADGGDTDTDSDADTDPLVCDTGVATPPAAPYFTDVTDEAGLGDDLTLGFGRPLAVDLDGDLLDDLLLSPAHDGEHPVPPASCSWLALRNTGAGFEDFTAASGLDAASAGLLVFGDLDNDGDQDAYGGVIAADPDNLVEQDGWGVWRNDGSGAFTHEGANGTKLLQLECGDYTCTASEIAASLVDFDGDGNLDLYLGSWEWSDGVTDVRYTPPGRDQLFQGNGDGTFVDRSDDLPVHNPPPNGVTDPVSASFGRAAMGTAPGDFDNDGDMDLFVANYGAGRPGLGLCEPPMYWDRDLLWRNDGDFAFDDVATEAGVAATTRGPSGIAEEEPLVMGDDCPEDVQGTYPSPIGGNSFTPQFGDFDNDGDLDLVVGAISHPDYLQADPTLLFVNQGAPDWAFTEESLERGLEYREDEKHVYFVDMDNDGQLDIAATGFRDAATNDFRVYLQQEDHTFALAIEGDETGITDRKQEGAAWLDYDGDGDLDLFIAKDAENGLLFRNEIGDDNHRIALHLTATAPVDATGARVTIQSSAGPQLREVTGPHGHYNPQFPRTVYFGLGGDTCATGVSIRWPDGQLQEIGDLAADRLYTVVQGEAPVVVETF